MKSFAAAERAVRLMAVALTAEAAFRILVGYVRRTDLPFEHVGFAVQALDGSAPRHAFSTVGEAFLSEYVAKRRTIDPLSMRVLRTTAPFTFDVRDYGDEPHPLLAYLVSQGLTAGVVIPVRLHTGHTGAAYYMCGGTREDVRAALIAHPTHLLFVTQCFADRVAQLMSPPQTLSREERQCLVLLAGGFEFDVIAERTGLTERRVKYIIDQLRARLGATNRPHLVHIAHSSGLL